MKTIELNREDIGKGNIVLIHPDYLLKQNDVQLEQFNDEYSHIQLSKTAMCQLHRLLDHIHAGNQIVPISGYRSLQEQIQIYESCFNEHGKAYTEKYVALPNASEHQSGLAIDLAVNGVNIDLICPSFPNEGICQTFRIHAPYFGFIERYQEDKTNITRIAKEEWHFRYVGIPHAAIITKHHFCLEEYMEYLKQFTYPNHPLTEDQFLIFYLPCIESQVSFEVAEERQIVDISGNNIDGFILTMKG